MKYNSRIPGGINNSLLQAQKVMYSLKSESKEKFAPGKRKHCTAELCRACNATVDAEFGQQVYEELQE